jgi:hypothetical protein
MWTTTKMMKRSGILSDDPMAKALLFFAQILLKCCADTADMCTQITDAAFGAHHSVLREVGGGAQRAVVF